MTKKFYISGYVDKSSPEEPEVEKEVCTIEIRNAHFPFEVLATKEHQEVGTYRIDLKGPGDVHVVFFPPFPQRPQISGPWRIQEEE